MWFIHPLGIRIERSVQECYRKMTTTFPVWDVIITVQNYTESHIRYGVLGFHAKGKVTMVLLKNKEEDRRVFAFKYSNLQLSY
jgi:hypothetical protein